MMSACGKARAPAESALPSTSATRGVGLARNLCVDPQIALPDDGDAVEDGEEEHALRQDARREKLRDSSGYRLGSRGCG